MKHYIIIGMLLFNGLHAMEPYAKRLYSLERSFVISFPPSQELKQKLDKSGCKEIADKTNLHETLGNKKISPIEVFVYVTRAAKDYYTDVNGNFIAPQPNSVPTLRDKLLPIVLEHDNVGYAKTRFLE